MTGAGFAVPVMHTKAVMNMIVTVVVSVFGIRDAPPSWLIQKLVRLQAALLGIAKNITPIPTVLGDAALMKVMKHLPL